jgi:hypothetical protein
MAIRAIARERQIMTVILFIIGVVLLVLLLLDVHSTVFVPRGGAGLISRRVYKGMWALWRGLGNRVFGGERRRWWLAQAGALMVPMTVVIWGAMLIGSFTLIYARWLEGFSISPPESGPMPDWAILLYYSGYSAVTLGVGDIVPNGTIPRLLVVVEAGLGFALFTASISYLLSVYNARNQATALALALSHLTGRRKGQEPADLLARTITSGSVGSLDTWMVQISLSLATLVEMSGQYPLLRYFHEPNDNRAIPLTMGYLLELTGLCRAVLDPDAYPELARGPSVRTVQYLGMQLLEESGTWESPDPSAAEARRHARYVEARRILTEAGIRIRADADAWPRFRELAESWDLRDDGMRSALGYPREAAAN